jgi:hypothetical protein
MGSMSLLLGHSIENFKFTVFIFFFFFFFILWCAIGLKLPLFYGCYNRVWLDCDHGFDIISYKIEFWII